MSYFDTSNENRAENQPMKRLIETKKSIRSDVEKLLDLILFVPELI